jgi:hypothetical protein
MANTAAPATTRYTITVDATEVLIYVYRTAGICGPAQFAPRPSTLDEVDEWIAAQRFTRTSGYRIDAAYDGLRLEADIAPRD